jgi:hypothetical protein
VISSYQPFRWAVKISNSRNIRFRNLHCYSNSKVSFDSAVYDQTHNVEIRNREFAWLNLSGNAPHPKRAASSPLVARGAKVQKLAGGFYNISGGAAGPKGDFYFVDAHWQRIHRWDPSGKSLSTVCDFPLEPVNVLADKAGNLVVVSYSGKGVIYSVRVDGGIAPLKSEPAAERAGKSYYLPVSDWRANRESLSRPAAHFISPDGTSILPAAEDFLNGGMSWGVKSSPQIRSFGLAPARAGDVFYVTDEAELTTWAAEVTPDGSLRDFRLFAEQGGEATAVDSRGNVYIAAGQIYVYSPAGKRIDTIEVPERPLQVVFGGPNHRTLFIPARTSLYSVEMRYPGRR